MEDFTLSASDSSPPPVNTGYTLHSFALTSFSFLFVL
jgi:hypothetical protein